MTALSVCPLWPVPWSPRRRAARGGGFLEVPSGLRGPCPGGEHEDEAQPEGTSVTIRSLIVLPLSLCPSSAGRPMRGRREGQRDGLFYRTVERLPQT
jgi:hypothetical protein